jgi:RNA polymerase sigma-70 factor (ECF subfamily)
MLEDRESVTDFSELYRSHARFVHRFALLLSGDRSLADDITSETFVRLWHARERVVVTTVRGYLLAIARNIYLHELRRTRKGAAVGGRAAGQGLESSSAPALDGVAECLPDPSPDPERLAGSRDELRGVLAALQALPELDRAAVLMRADDGLSYEEIAAALALSPAAARVRVHRARLRLAEARRLLDAEKEIGT